MHTLPYKAGKDGMNKEKCNKIGDCRCKGWDGYCFYSNDCEYKGEKNKALKSSVLNSYRKMQNYSSQKI